MDCRDWPQYSTVILLKDLMRSRVRKVALVLPARIDIGLTEALRSKESSAISSLEGQPYQYTTQARR